MSSAKDIILQRIDSKSANAFVRRHHYSGKVVTNSQLHFGAFLNGRMHGVMSFGPSLDKSKIIGLVKGTGWNDFIELNRMAFDAALPRNSESRCIAIAMKLLKKHCPQVKWVISFADATQCGDGAIYSASGFMLTGISESKNIARLPDGTVVHKMTLQSNPLAKQPYLGGRSYADIMQGAQAWDRFLEIVKGEVLTGYQLRYIYFIDKGRQQDLTVPIVPFSKIDEVGAGMYKGQKQTLSERKHAVVA